MTRPAFEECVFINCGFTPDFEEMRQAFIFAVVDCGFVPRCALEIVDSSEVRIDKIFRLIEDCKHGLHDISATEPNANGLPRFNMPLELGIFLGAKRFGADEQRNKTCLILDREPYRYQEFCSDIAGQDPEAHSGEPRQAIERIRKWLRSQRPDVRLPSGKRMADRFERFRADLPSLCDSLGLEEDTLEFYDLTTVIDEWILGSPP